MTYIKNNTTLLQSNVMHQLRGNVGYFKEKGGTVGWMINNDGIVIVDTQFLPQAINLQNAIHQISPKDIDVLFNTHHHKDHTSGNIVFRDKTNHIVAHENALLNQKAEDVRNDDEPTCYPNLTFDIDYNLHIGDESIKAYYYGPAHTNGDIVIHFQKSNVVHIGDLVYNRSYPYIDKISGASIANWITVLDTIINEYDDDTMFITGHALKGYEVVIDKEDIKAFSDYLEKLISFGRSCIKHGWSVEVALKETVQIPRVNEWSGEGIERSILAIYEELAL